MMRLWFVTLLEESHEIVIEVTASTKEGARRESRRLHPRGHIIHVEQSKEKLDV